MQNNKNFIKDLVCPKCKGQLYLEDKQDGLICKKCRLLYPIREGIPIMLVEQSLNIDTIKE
ncbi:MAG: Trm112 family protein [Deltaproteobacteria bacterium]|nr:Trm112 family protein [Deltaproteobacteria bacterium]